MGSRSRQGTGPRTLPSLGTLRPLSRGGPPRTPRPSAQQTHICTLNVNKNTHCEIAGVPVDKLPLLFRGMAHKLTLQVPVETSSSGHVCVALVASVCARET